MWWTFLVILLVLLQQHCLVFTVGWAHVALVVPRTTRHSQPQSYRGPNDIRCVRRQRSLVLLQSSSSAKNPEDHADSIPQQEYHPPRARVAGVSVSPTGFWVILQQPQPPSQQDEYYYWPLQVTTATTTDNNEDTVAATSAPALTLLQLLAGLDLAGMVLPPEVLAQVVVVACEQSETATDEIRTLSKWVQQTVQEAWDRHVVPRNPPGKNNHVPQPPQSWRYTDQTAWIQSRVRLPEVILKELVIVPTIAGSGDPPMFLFQLQCTVVFNEEDKDSNNNNKNNNHNISVRVTLTDTVLQDICYEYQPNVSQAFIALALALRYKAPIRVVVDNDNNNTNTNRPRLTQMHELRTQFPAYRAADEVLQPADRSVAVLERGLEIHQFQAAWQLARQRGDTVAAAKIRLALDELDRQSLNELPVQADTDLGSMQ